MEIDIQIRNLTRRRVDMPLIKRAIAVAVDGEDRFAGERVEISVVLVGKKRMAAINQKYRGVALATDVLSFAHCEGEEFAGERILGELVVCPAQVAADAESAGVSARKETAWVAIHGTLHLLGYDHEKNEAAAVRMRDKERGYLKQILNYK